LQAKDSGALDEEKDRRTAIRAFAWYGAREGGGRRVLPGGSRLALAGSENTSGCQEDQQHHRDPAIHFADSIRTPRFHAQRRRPESSTADLTALC
jgi:hypothetical protein